MELQVVTNRVYVEPCWWRFDKHILQARRIGDQVMIIFDYMSYPQGRPAPNLISYDLHQRELWTAENPGGGADAYVNFITDSPLKVWNFSCFICTLDESTGKLIKKEFTK